MKRYKISIMALALLAGVTSCSDWLEQEPPSQLTPDGFLNDASRLEAATNALYTAVLPSHNRWGYGMYGEDQNTDNQAVNSPTSMYGNGLWLVGSTNDNWSWTNIRNINYQLNNALEMYNSKNMSGDEKTIRQYLGEMYFFRAYSYFKLLQKFGDLPIVTTAMPDDEAVLVAANKRQPCNEVARFIINTLDTAATYMTPDFVKHTRVSYDAAQLLKSRVALYEASWLTNFKGTPFVPNGEGWPGAAKDYNQNYQYPAGSIDEEAKYFYTAAAEAAQIVADKYVGKLSKNTGVVPQSSTDPSNPYMALWGTNDMSGTPEIILWRQYDRSLGVVNNVETMTNHGNYGIGLTRSYVENFLMKDGKPIYASEYTYSDKTIADVAKDRDPRLAVFLKVPGQKNYFINENSSLGDHAVAIEPQPNITNKSAENGYSTGYTIRKGAMFDKSVAGNGDNYNACALFRATEALLNYMEAEYMLTNNLSSGKILEYWRAIREAAGFTGEALNPQVTIDATDMAKEAVNDWGAYSGGKVLTDKVLYNIRRERRSELMAEGLRNMDLHRWRSFDQLMTTPYHIEGIHLWNTGMDEAIANDATVEKQTLVYEGQSGTPNVSAPSRSEYYRPTEVNSTNNFYNGLTWHMAHYLDPLPIRQFLLTATDHASVDQSPLYQNPYWSTTAGEAAEK